MARGGLGGTGMVVKGRQGGVGHNCEPRQSLWRLKF